MTASELEVLNHYNKKMLRYDESPDIILKCLWKLDRVQVNIALLQNTGIGRTVSALKKKYGESEVGTIAKELVLKWKNVVAKEEEELENEDSEVNENENDDNENCTPPSSISHSSQYGNSSFVTNSAETLENRTQDESSSTQDEEQVHRRKSKKKKSHRERSEERKSTKREEKEKKARHHEKEKSRKHKNNEKEKERDSRSNNSSLPTKDVKKDKNDRLKHCETTKIKTESCSSSSSGKIPQNRSLSGSKSDKSYKQTSPNDLSSIDMFKNIVEDCDKETRTKKRSSNSYPREEAQNSKRSRMEPPKSSVVATSLGPSLIPDISPIYKPLPRVNMSVYEKQATDDRNKDEESLSLLLSNKSKGRAAIYSGEKRKGFARGTEVPSLFSQCMQVLKDNVDYIEEVGGLGYDILKPVLVMANAETLIRIEDTNPHLMEDTAELWEKFVKKKFYKKDRQEMESWREMYERCVEEQAIKLNALKGRVKQTYKAEEDSHRKTKLAYVDVAPKAPRSIRNAQVKHGTALPSGAPMVAGGARPRNLIGDPTANSHRAGFSSKKPKTAPLMAKTFKLMKGIKGGFRR